MCAGSPTAVNGGLAQVGNWFVHNGSLHPQERCFAWCRRNHCLFVDQPAMTGLSFQTNSTGGASTGKQIEYTKTSAQAMEQVYQVLQQFLQIWPQMQEQPYFIQGLSYAGMYVPWMVSTFIESLRNMCMRVPNLICNWTHLVSVSHSCSTGLYCVATQQGSTCWRAACEATRRVSG